MQVGSLHIQTNDLSQFLYHTTDGLLDTLKVFGRRVIYSFKAKMWLNSENIFRLVSSTQNESDLKLFDRVSLKPALSQKLQELHKHFRTNRYERLAKLGVVSSSFTPEIMKDETSFSEHIERELQPTVDGLRAVVQNFRNLGLDPVNILKEDLLFVFNHVDKPILEQISDWIAKDRKYTFIQAAEDAKYYIIEYEEANKVSLIRDVKELIGSYTCAFSDACALSLSPDQKILYKILSKPSLNDDDFLKIKKSVPHYTFVFETLKRKIFEFDKERLSKIGFHGLREGETYEKGLEEEIKWTMKPLTDAIKRAKQMGISIKLSKDEQYIYDNLNVDRFQEFVETWSEKARNQDLRTISRNLKKRLEDENEKVFRAKRDEIKGLGFLSGHFNYNGKELGSLEEEEIDIYYTLSNFNNFTLYGHDQHKSFYDKSIQIENFNSKAMKVIEKLKIIRQVYETLNYHGTNIPFDIPFLIWDYELSQFQAAPFLDRFPDSDFVITKRKRGDSVQTLVTRKRKTVPDAK